jgi:hypothetical protein
MGFQKNSSGKPIYNSDITDPVGQFQAAVDFADEVGNRIVGTFADRNASTRTYKAGTLYVETDTGDTYLRVSNAWKLQTSPWKDFTPAYVGWSGFTTQYAKIRRSPGLTEVRYSAVGTASAAVADMQFKLPDAPASWVLDTDPVGTCLFIDTSTAQRFLGALLKQNDNARLFIVGASGLTQGTTASSPLPWTSGDVIKVNLAYATA